ncbi:bifunctional heptose 7-phosphate kinase/heptose 1-phosphate adenyltransferase [Horticoccus sp. 23ND18S-11]|uniref:bifunctional heptose 7-phosphate kinase/heptose 1-phosphate adenyltransferase n=1 Tax=Horticoccus sp. 23ND18S-11 TaxID=3391832 RepID=UPI0039C99E55
MKGLAPLLKKIAKVRVLVVGDVMLDHYIWGDATRISPEAPVPVVDIARDSWTAGGAANVALNIASLGAHCTVAGYIGADDAGAKLTSILHGKKIDTIATPGSAPTIVKTRVLVQHQQLCRLDREAAPTEYQFPAAQIDTLLAREIDAADAVILSDYAKGILSDEIVARVTSLARKAGKFVALDPKPKRRLKFHGLDLITPNKREALQLAELEPPPHTPFPAAEVCARLHERYATKHLVITLGEDGMLLSSDGRILKTIPTAAREVFDVSGAGDTSLAGLVLALAAGSTLEAAAHFANAAAGVVVGKIGTATVTPTELIDYVNHR